MLRNVIQNVKDAVETPLTQPVDAEHLFLIVGIVIVAIGFWFMVLSHIRAMAEAAVST